MSQAISFVYDFFLFSKVALAGRYVLTFQLNSVFNLKLLFDFTNISPIKKKWTAFSLVTKPILIENEVHYNPLSGERYFIDIILVNAIEYLYTYIHFKLRRYKTIYLHTCDF